LRSRSISRPPRIPEHIPPLPYADSSHISSDFRNGEPSNVRSRADSGPESDTESDNGSSVTLNTTPFEALKARLQPLRHLEQLLVAKLVPPNEDEATHLAGPSHSIYPPGQLQNHSAANAFRNQEVFIRPGAGWRGALSKARVNNPNVSDDDAHAYENRRPYSTGNIGLETADEPQEVLHLCQKDLILLWNDHAVREILRRKKVRLEEFPGL
jgi:guanine nucleotide-binding protein alpha-1 subunit